MGQWSQPIPGDQVYLVDAILVASLVLAGIPKDQLVERFLHLHQIVRTCGFMGPVMNEESGAIAIVGG
jgi:hypothetical protein